METFGMMAAWQPPLWTPAALSPGGWYDAELSPKTFGTGTTVAQCDDLSGNGKHIGHPNSGQRPTYDSVNQWFDFDGSDDGFIPITTGHGILPSGNTPAMIAFVLRKDNTTYATFFQQGTSVNHQSMFIGTGTSWSYDIWGGFNYSTGTTATANVDHLLVCLYTGAQRQLWLNGSMIGSVNYSSLNLTQANLQIGGARLGTRYDWNGKMRTIVAAADPSTDRRQRLEGYLAHRWGLLASLPGGHPYKINPPRTH